MDDLAKRRRTPLTGVSLGQGQEPAARRARAAARDGGGWVLLQNAHLGLSFMPSLEAILAETTPCHPDFRLFITVASCDGFPAALLQAGVKVTDEAPAGVRAGLRNTYRWLTQDTLDAVGRAEWRPLLYAAAFMHSVLQERRRFGPAGWVVPYDFGRDDLAAVTSFLQACLVVRRGVQGCRRGRHALRGASTPWTTANTLHHPAHLLS